jgi:type VI secretion system protein ImpA
LKKLMQRVADAALRAQADGASPSEMAAETTSGRAPSHGAIASREDAIRALDRVCEWMDRNEPSHPAPLLIRRAKRLISKNFIEIIRDLAPDGLSQVEKLAGTSHS